MSISDPIWPLVYWDENRGRGVARSAHVTVELGAPPTVAAGIESLYFAPTLDAAYIITSYEGRRDLSPSERSACRCLLEGIDDAVRPLVALGVRR